MRFLLHTDVLPAQPEEKNSSLILICIEDSIIGRKIKGLSPVMELTFGCNKNHILVVLMTTMRQDAMKNENS